MTGTPARSRPGAHPRGARSGGSGGRGNASPNPFLAAAQILLGVVLSCLIGMLGLLALAAVVGVAVYLAR